MGADRMSDFWLIVISAISVFGLLFLVAALWALYRAATWHLR